MRGTGAHRHLRRGPAQPRRPLDPAGDGVLRDRHHAAAPGARVRCTAGDDELDLAAPAPAGGAPGRGRAARVWPRWPSPSTGSGRLQRDVPGYTTALEDHIESTNSACTQLQQLSGEHQNQFAAANAKLEGKKATCSVTDAGNTVSGRLAAGHTTTTTTTTSPARTPGSTPVQKAPVFMASKTDLPALGPGPELHGHHGLVQHTGQPASHSERAPRQGRAGRLLDLFLHQLPALAAPCRGLVQRLQEGRLGRRRRLRAEFAFEHVVSNVESAAGEPRDRLSGGHRRQPGHLGRLQQRVLARRVPDRSALVSCAPTTSARAATARWRATSGCCSRPTASPTSHRGRTCRTRRRPTI